MNKVILVGNLARDPELRQTPQGTSVARFTIAVQRPYQKDGQRQADFIDCTAWRSTAEFICKYFRKGSGMQLCGRLQVDSWDGQDGQKRYRTEVVVDEVSFNGPARSQNGGDGSYYQGNNGGSYQNRTAAPAAPAPAQNAPSVNSDFAGDLDIMGFDDLDGSEDDLPF